MDYPMFISIGDWLDSIKMSQYKSNFMAAGYNTLDSVARMSIEWVEESEHNLYVAKVVIQICTPASSLYSLWLLLIVLMSPVALKRSCQKSE